MPLMRDEWRDIQHLNIMFIYSSPLNKMTISNEDTQDLVYFEQADISLVKNIHSIKQLSKRCILYRHVKISIW